MGERLSKYVPGKALEAEVILVEKLAPVIERIGQFLPDDVLWDMFSSGPTETGGKIRFPYSRVDSAVIIARDRVWMLDHCRDKFTPEEFQECYEKACIQALKALLWVEIGFQGLENLAISPASRNWTSVVGHFVNDEERAKRIMTTGKAMYVDCLRKFIDFREREGITDDLFVEYGVEYLLETILQAEVSLDYLDLNNYPQKEILDVVERLTRE